MKNAVIKKLLLIRLLKGTFIIYFKTPVLALVGFPLKYEITYEI